MTKHLAVMAGVLAMAGCASSRKESQEAFTPTTQTQTVAPDRSADEAREREQANADLASTRARLQEAQRELEAARSEWVAADAEAKGAQAQMDAANRLTDSVAQARVSEIARAAETHGRTATTHLDYANKLVAARQADVDAAQLHVRTGAAGNPAVSTSGSQPTNQRLVDAQNAETAARQRAAELGRAALDAQRAWENASSHARAGTSAAAATTHGTGSGTPVTDVPTPSAAKPTGR